MSFLTGVLIAIIALFLTLVILPRLLMGIKAAKLKGKPAPTPHKQSARRIKSGAKTILYFYTPTCGACRMQEPIIQRVKEHFPDAIFKIDASTNREAASAYGVMGVPFLACIDQGKIVSARAGVQQEAAILGFLNSTQANS